MTKQVTDIVAYLSWPGLLVSFLIGDRAALMPDQLELSSKSGDCEAAIPEGQGFALRFSTVSGELDTGFPLVGPLGSRSGEAMYLDGGGRSYRMSTVSGDLTIRPL